MLQLKTHNPKWITRTPIAHRGLHESGVPENSLAAFKAAVQAGYAIEFDIRLTADKKLIILHDATTARMTELRLVVKQRLASELTSLKLLDSEEKIPLLHNALDAIAGRAPILIEVKKNIPMRELGPLLVKALADYRGEVAVASFDPRVVWWLRRHAPHIVRVQIAGSLPEKATPSWLRKLFKSMPLNGLTRPDAMVFDYRDIPDRAVSFWQKRLGIPVILWTISTPHDLERARQGGYNFGFDNIRP
jgi:glycerophosphoryl diester phosphodiesterase